MGPDPGRFPRPAVLGRRNCGGTLVPGRVDARSGAEGQRDGGKAAAVFGNLLTRRADEDNASVLSNESFQVRMFADNYVDAFALFDAVQVRELGGYADDERVR